MKKIFLLIAITLLFVGCENTTTTDTRPTQNDHNTSGRYDNSMYNKEGIQVHIIKNAYGTILRSTYLEKVALKAFEKYGIDDAYLDEFTNIYFKESSQLDNTKIHQELVESIVKEMAGTQQNVDNQLAGEDSTITESTQTPQTNYTYSDLNMTLYAKSSVNTRKGPSTDFEKVGSLTLNQEVQVTGQCNETGWYRINVGGQEMFVSGSYLVTNPIQQSQPSGEGSSSGQSNSNTDSSGSQSSSGNPFAENKDTDWGEDTGASMDWSNNYSSENPFAENYNPDWGGSDGSSIDWSNNYSTGQGSSNIGVGGDGNTGQLLYRVITSNGTFTFTTCQKCFDARCGVIGCSCEAKCHSRQ